MTLNKNFGGGGGSRTHVRRLLTERFSECRLLLNFPCITRVSNSYRVSPLTPSAMAHYRVRLPANLKPGYSSRRLAGLLPN